MREEVLSDLDDLAHDKELLDGAKAGALRMVSRRRPCPTPALCDFRCGRVCRVCRKKSGPLVETVRLESLYLAIRGGLRLGPDDLSFAQWQLLGELAIRHDRGMI